MPMQQQSCALEPLRLSGPMAGSPKAAQIHTF